MNRFATKFQHPVEPILYDPVIGSNVFGEEGRPGLYHLGADYWVAYQDVEPIANGYVVEIGYNDSFGIYAVVKHTLPTGDEIYSLYAHLSSISSEIDPDGYVQNLYQQDLAAEFLGEDVEGSLDVNVFVSISQGDIIGVSGNTGDGGVHLHLEIADENLFNKEDPDYARGYDTADSPAFGELSNEVSPDGDALYTEGEGVYDPVAFIENYQSYIKQFADDVKEELPVQGPQQFASNSGFETGDLSGWDVRGLASVQTSFDADGENGPTGDGETTPTEGSYFAVLESSGSISVAQIEDFLGLDSGDLASISDGTATTGTAIKIEVDVVRDTAFDFDFYFDAGDYEPFNDFAFMVIDGELVAFGDVTDVGNYGDSGWQDSSWFESGTTDLDRGTHEIGFGILDVGDEILSSALYLDDFHFV